MLNHPAPLPSGWCRAARQLTVQVVADSGDLYSVFAYDTADPSGSSVNALLVREGFATPVPGGALDIDAILEQGERDDDNPGRFTTLTG